MRFTNAYAAGPVCSPTRASILTGKYPARLDMTYIVGGKRPTNRKLLPPKAPAELPMEEVTIAESLRPAGYTTHFIGKWHLGNEMSNPSPAKQQGFHKHIGKVRRGLPVGAESIERKRWMGYEHFYPFQCGGVSVDLPGTKEGDYLADAFTDSALQFVEQNQDNPFLLYLSHFSVHAPIEGKKEYKDRYKKKIQSNPNLPQKHSEYAAMVQSVDDSVGRIMDKLEDLKIADNTVVVFTSDNGGWSHVTNNSPLHGGKAELYEGGIRVPTIVKWPGVTKPASICNESIVSTDFYPTILEIAGLPLMPQQHLDGVSVVPLLKQKGCLNREAIYFHFPHYHAETTPCTAVRMGDWKLIEFYEGKIELYNLRTDIGEKTDLALKMPGKVTELQNMLQKWRKNVGARMPVRNTIQH
jgi:arylsulfatase A-like enzyme